MPLSPVDRSLRRLVAELAALGDADVQAILSELTQEERSRVQALLNDYAGSDALAATAATTADEVLAPINTLGLSPWLVERLNLTTGPEPQGTLALFRLAGRSRTRRRPPPAITPSAAEALRACAIAVQGRAAPEVRPAVRFDWRRLAAWRPALSGARA